MSPEPPSPVYPALARRRLFRLLAVGLALLVSFMADVLTGPAMLPPSAVLSALFAPQIADQVTIIVWEIRLPVALMAMAVGTALGVSGATMQTILHNPLASPYTLGLSAAAGVGAAIVMLWPASGPGLRPDVPMGAAIGAALVSFTIFGLARRRGMSAELMTLSGIALLFLFQSLQSYLQYLASPEVLQQIVFWLFGSLQKANWPELGLVVLMLGLSLPLLLRQAWQLSALKLGDDRAGSLGVEVERVRMHSFAIISVLTATAVCFVGTIAFVGLIAPHIARILVGEDQRYFLPLAGFTGALLLSSASVASKLLLPGAVIPVGIVTSLVGVPFFVALLLSNRQRYW